MVFVKPNVKYKDDSATTTMIMKLKGKKKEKNLIRNFLREKRSLKDINKFLRN